MPPAQTDPWPNITELLDQAGGHIGIGRMPPIEGAAVAVTETELIASLVRRDEESFPSSGCASAAIAFSRHCCRSEGNTPFSRHQALRCASSTAAVAIIASRRASACHRCNVATDTLISWDTLEISALSGGSNRATARSLNSLPYRATVVPQCPQGYRGIEATTTVTQGGIRPGIALSKLVVANALRQTLPEFLLSSTKSDSVAKFILERQDPERMQLLRLAS